MDCSLRLSIKLLCHFNCCALTLGPSLLSPILFSLTETIGIAISKSNTSRINYRSIEAIVSNISAHKAFFFVPEFSSSSRILWHVFNGHILKYTRRLPMHFTIFYVIIIVVLKKFKMEVCWDSWRTFLSIFSSLSMFSNSRTRRFILTCCLTNPVGGIFLYIVAKPLQMSRSLSSTLPALIQFGGLWRREGNTDVWNPNFVW